MIPFLCPNIEYCITWTEILVTANPSVGLMRVQRSMTHQHTVPQAATECWYLLMHVNAVDQESTSTACVTSCNVRKTLNKTLCAAHKPLHTSALPIHESDSMRGLSTVMTLFVCSDCICGNCWLIQNWNSSIHFFQQLPTPTTDITELFHHFNPWKIHKKIKHLYFCSDQL